MLPAVIAMWMTFGLAIGATAGWWAVIGGLLVTWAMAIAGVLWSVKNGREET